MTESTFSVRVTPRAAQDKIAGWDGEILRVRVAAPPVEGRANDALLRLLARARRADKPAAPCQGHRQRNKVVAVEGLSEEELRARV